MSIAAFLVLTALLSSCYETSQGFRYLALRSKGIAFQKALSDPATPTQVKTLIERAGLARKFALRDLGLRETPNYTAIVMLDADRLATVVQACAELSFDRWLWDYPFVGKLPYRGYFDPREAEAEAARLRAKGLDVIARPVDAFSTLGWFSDPLFSFMASYSEAEIADLVIHEMTHATVFVKGQDDFNEGLATFVGREGAILYLTSEYGSDSPLIAKARNDRDDAKTLASWLRETADQLEKLYASPSPAHEKRQRKAELIAARAAAYKSEYRKLFKGDSYLSYPMDRLNNAWLDLYRLYEGEEMLFLDYYARICGSDMKRFMEAMSRIAKKEPDAREVMRKELAALP